MSNAAARLETRIKELRCAASPRPQSRGRSESGAPPGRAQPAERRDVDPKGGDLCEARAKPAERLVEARSSVDVQITCPSFVKGRKTHRTAK